MPCRLFVLLALMVTLVGCGQDRSVSRGAALYAQTCAICHGMDKRGGGGANVAGLSKTPSDLTVLARDNGGEFPATQVLALLENYADGTQVGRRMRPFSHLASDDTTRVRTAEGRNRVPAPQAAILAYLQSVQRD